MPKISAATVAEHRAMKERQVIAAAVELLTTEGASAVTPAAVAERAGLARTSVYQYARSGNDLAALAVEEIFLQVNASLTAALDAAGPEPAARLEAIIRTILQGAVDGHAPDQALDVAALGAAQQERLRQLHQDLVAPLSATIAGVAGVGSGDVAMLTAISWGAINGVVPLIEHGLPVDRAVPMVVAYVRAGTEAAAR
ncbi:TetR/AcrR family transcriptional regulator [Raineyella sp.]|uniref:TetR/AcrR family transcriptional regulator n=1 Tax=Raineyella sp. TaxID=1911550 RepID=UPI002B20F1ED|nr:TetR/AcrR family transcriptional regulator [Raineyella sp.]MEA5153773.1 TetR/AcrR family transcriptional regulator [Raineyella sp.]